MPLATGPAGTVRTMVLAPGCSSAASNEKSRSTQVASIPSRWMAPPLPPRLVSGPTSLPLTAMPRERVLASARPKRSVALPALGALAGIAKWMVQGVARPWSWPVGLKSMSCGTGSRPQAGVRQALQILPEKSLHRSLVLAHHNQPPVVLAGNRVNVPLAQKPHVVHLFQLLNRTGIVTSVLQIELADGAHIDRKSVV